MPDLLDHAQGTETQFTEVALANQRLRTRHHADQESKEACEECGEPIPEARRKAIQGCQHCVDCQSRIERGAHA